LTRFNTPLEKAERIVVTRAFNVIRQYSESCVQPAHRIMGNQLEPDGLLVDGTSDPLGRLWTANVLRKRISETKHAFVLPIECVVFSTNFKAGFDPADFLPLLPKNFLHRAGHRGELINEFFETWRACHARFAHEQKPWAGRSHTPLSAHRRVFALTALALRSEGFLVRIDSGLLRRGFLVWQFQAEVTARFGVPFDDQDRFAYDPTLVWDGTWTAPLTGQ
jgi:hypothetical protein